MQIEKMSTKGKKYKAWVSDNNYERFLGVGAHDMNKGKYPKRILNQNFEETELWT